MKKYPMLIAAGLLSASLATASVAGSKGGCHKGGDRYENRDMLMSQLNLSEEQKSAIQALRSQHREQKKAQREMRTEKPRLVATPDQADYEQQVQVFAKAKAAAMEAKIVEKARMRAEVYALLTPEQQSQWLELRRKMKEERGDKMRELRREKREAREQSAS